MFRCLSCFKVFTQYCNWQMPTEELLLRHPKQSSFCGLCKHLHSAPFKLCPAFHWNTAEHRMHSSGSATRPVWSSGNSWELLRMFFFRKNIICTCSRWRAEQALWQERLTAAPTIYTHTMPSNIWPAYHHLWTWEEKECTHFCNCCYFLSHHPAVLCELPHLEGNKRGKPNDCM